MLSALEMDCLHFLITSVGEGWRGRREEGIMLGEFRKQRASCEMTFLSIGVTVLSLCLQIMPKLLVCEVTV